MKSLLEQDRELRRVAFGTLEGLLAFGFGSGLSRYAPGTAGTAAAIPFGQAGFGPPFAPEYGMAEAR